MSDKSRLVMRSFKFDRATNARLTWLGERYSTYTRALAVAIDLLYEREYDLAVGTTHYQHPDPEYIEHEEKDKEER